MLRPYMRSLCAAAQPTPQALRSKHLLSMARPMDDSPLSTLITCKRMST